MDGESKKMRIWSKMSPGETYRRADQKRECKAGKKPTDQMKKGLTAEQKKLCDSIKDKKAKTMEIKKMLHTNKAEGKPLHKLTKIENNACGHKSWGSSELDKV